jgi:pyruvate-formate lyase-activating enzyme
MKVDLAAFQRHYLSGLSLPLSLAAGWRATGVREDRIRWAVDFDLVDAEGRAVLLYVERRLAGRRALATTGHLAASYYEPVAPVDERGLATAVRALVGRLAEAEARLDDRAIDEIFTTAATGAASERASHGVELRINRDCNEDCLFCNTPADSNAILEGRPQVLEEMLKLFQLGHRTVTFTGREPTLDPNLEDYVRRARALGYTEVRLQTNGTTFSSMEVCRRLVEAGIDQVQLSLHTFREPTFKVLVGAPRLLEKSLQGLRNMLSMPRLKVEVLCVVTALNVGELEEFTRTLCRDYATLGRGLTLVLSPMAPQGAGELRVDLLARFDELSVRVGRALAVARDAGVQASIPHRCGMPLCVTPREFRPVNLSYYAASGDNVEGGKRRAEKCGACAFQDRCVGVWKHYLDRFGDAELRPLTAADLLPSADRPPDAGSDRPGRAAG